MPTIHFSMFVPFFSSKSQSSSLFYFFYISVYNYKIFTYAYLFYTWYVYACMCIYIWIVPRRELPVMCDNLGYYFIIVYLLFQVFCLLRES